MAIGRYLAGRTESAGQSVPVGNGKAGIDPWPICICAPQFAFPARLIIVMYCIMHVMSQRGPH